MIAACKDGEVDGDKATLIRPREAADQLYASERLLP